MIKAIDEIGYESPMPIQEEVIPYLLGEGNDVIALAQTGTGKTAAYGLPLLQKVKKDKEGIQAVILSPTRELCLQIADDLKEYSKYLEHVHVLAVYGGADIGSQIKALKKGVQIVVATPGRLIDLMERKAAKLDGVENVVLDEADEMLNMGFTESIDAILAGVPKNRNTLLFSATMSRDIEKIARNYLTDPKEIVVGSRNEGAEKVNHEYYLVHARDKYAALKRIVDYQPKIYAIIFCRTRMETQEVADKLIQDGYNAEALHGELSQAQRDLTMQKFRQKRVQLLVATDVAARGLDVDDLTHVINYGLPEDIESYTHRSGRTGRAGKRGTSISIVHLREKGKIRRIEKEIGKKFVRCKLPTPKEICTKQLYNVIDKLERTEVDEEQIAPFMPEVMRKLAWMDKDDIVKRIVAMQKFRQKRVQLLVATDVAARGLDVDDLTHVINYGLPEDIESYTHRSGRTGRAGKRGTSISIVHLREKGKIRRIEKEIGKKFVRCKLPTPKEICTKQLYNVIDKLERTEVDEEQIAPFMPEVMRKLAWMDKDDIVKRIVASAFGRFVEYYSNAPEIVEPDEKSERDDDGGEGKSSRRDRRSRRQGGKGGKVTPEKGYKRLFINLGKRDGVYAREIIGLINKYVGGSVDIGRIDLTTSCSFFEVPEGEAPGVLKSFKKANYKGRRVVVDDAEATGTRHSDNGGAGKRRQKGGEKFRDEAPKNKKGRKRNDDFNDDFAPKGKQPKDDWKKFFEH